MFVKDAKDNVPITIETFILLCPQQCFDNLFF